MLKQMLFYHCTINEQTNLIQPSMGIPRPAQKVRLYGFQHVEPTRVPQEDIYHGDPKMTPSQAVEPSNVETLKQYIIDGMETKIKPTFDNDFRTTKGGSIPVNKQFPDFTKVIQFIGTDPKPNNLEGTVTLNVSLAAYYDEQGVYKTGGFPAVPITITGFKKVQQTKLNKTATISSDRTASEAVDAQFTGDSGIQQYPYLQYLLIKYKNEVFTGLPEGFNAGVIQIDQPQADNLNGTVTLQVSALMYYDQAGNLIDLTKNTPESAGKGAKPLGTIILSGFKKVVPTTVKNRTISVTGNLEFYNTLATQVDETKIASIIYNNKDTIFSSYPGLRFSVNSIKILKATPNNLSGTLNVEFALTRYYDKKGQYVEADEVPGSWLKFTGANSINIIGFTSVKPTQFVKKEFEGDFKPALSSTNKLDPSTTSITSTDVFKAFMDSKNSTGNKIFGGSDSKTPYNVNKTKSGPAGKETYSISLAPTERSAWEILQIGTKTIFQVSPTDIANFVLRVLQYSGMQNYGVNIKLSDIGVTITSDRNPDTVINSSNPADFNDTNWYKGSLSVDISINLADGVWTKSINFNGSADKSMNVFSRYVPLPVYTSSSQTEQNLSNIFTAGDIEQFIFQNIDQIINQGGKPVNFSNFNINISNLFYNNNDGTVSVLLTLDNFYLPSGNLSTDPSPSEAATAPKTLSTTVVFKGFKQQKATAFAPELSLVDAKAVIPYDITNLNGVTIKHWDEITPEEFWKSFTSDAGSAYGGTRQFMYDLIMGMGTVLPPNGATPNPNRILLAGAEIPKTFSKENIIGTSASWSNVDGRLDITFNIVNYYDLLGNLELTAPKTSKISLRG